MIRSITNDDTKIICNLNSTIFYDQIVYDKQFIEPYCKQGLGALVIDKDKPIGYILYDNTYFSELGLTGLTIVSIGVIESERKKNYGRKMITYLTNKFPAKDIYLHARAKNEPVIKFYENMKFKTIARSPCYYNLIKYGIEDAVIMKRESLATLIKKATKKKR